MSWYEDSEIYVPTMGAWNMPRPTTDDLMMVSMLSESINQEMGKSLLQHIIEDGELLELIRREQVSAGPA